MALIGSKYYFVWEKIVDQVGVGFSRPCRSKCLINELIDSFTSVIYLVVEIILRNKEGLDVTLT